jgi:hypothetical protein
MPFLRQASAVDVIIAAVKVAHTVWGTVHERYGQDFS